MADQVGGIATSRSSFRTNLVVGVLAVLAVAAIIAAWVTGGDTRAANPCASGWDNVWALCAAILICAATAASATPALVALAARRLNGAARGLLRTALIFLGLFAAWTVLAVGGYGWHCS